MGGKAVFLAALLLATAVSERAAAACKFEQVAELPVTMVGLAPTIQAKVDGVDATLETDTGAFFSSVTIQAAKRFKLHDRPLMDGLRIQGAVGTVRPSLGEAGSFTLAGATLRSVQFLVAGDQVGPIDGLLGQNVLGQFDTEVDLANGVIRLFRAQGCDGMVLAYWAKDLAVGSLPIEEMTKISPHVIGRAQVNGHEIHVVFDTGANLSGLSLSGARRAGLNLNAPGVRSGGLVRGIGPRATESWIVPVESFSIGGETIEDTELRVAGTDLDWDMLLGADFFLSHRVLISRSQRKVYFTYNGGPVFHLAPTPVGAQAPAAVTATATAGLDAGALVRRAKASEARGELGSAIADLSRAIELEPANAQYVFDRATIRRSARQAELAIGDLDRALKLKPDFTEALMMRGELHLAAHDLAGAQSDFSAAINSTPDKPQAAAVVAELYSKAGEFESAVARFDEAIAALPRDSELLNGRCWTRALWGRELDKALADCDAAIHIGPRRAAYFDSRGLAHLRRGELAIAVADYDAALKIQPKSPWSLFGRGLAKARMGDAAGSAADLSAAEALAPNIRAEAKRYGLTQETVVALKAPQS